MKYSKAIKKKKKKNPLLKGKGNLTVSFFLNVRVDLISGRK